MSGRTPSEVEMLIDKRMYLANSRKAIVERIIDVYKLPKKIVWGIINDYETMMAQLLMDKGYIWLRQIGVIRIVDTNKRFYNLHTKHICKYRGKKIIFRPAKGIREFLRQFIELEDEKNE